MIPKTTPIRHRNLPRVAFRRRALEGGKGVLLMNAMKISIRPRNIKSPNNHRLVTKLSFGVKRAKMLSKMLKLPIMIPIIESILITTLRNALPDKEVFCLNAG